MTSAKQFQKNLGKWAVYLILFTFFASKSWAQVGPPPVIIVQPIGITVPKQGTAVFMVVVSSVTTVSYQWYCDGKKIKNATGSVCTINKVSNGDAGSYDVVVKNASGSTTSSQATLSIGDSIKQLLKIDGWKMMKTGFQLQLSGVTNTCVVYASADMMNWTPISTNTPVSGNVTYTDLQATNHAFRYYKVLGQ